MTSHSLHYKSVLAVLTSLLVCGVALGQRTVSPFSAYTHDVWQTKEGLPQNSVSAITQTQDGYIWFGTQEGLVRFDGVRFIVYDKRNTRGLISNVVSALYESNDSSLWIGTDGGGVSRLKNGAFTSFTMRQGLVDNTVRAIAEDRQGTLWFGTSNGLSKLKEGQCVDAGLTMTYPWVNTLLLDHNGTMWVGTNGGGLYRLSGGKLSEGTEQNVLCGSMVMSLCEDSTGAIWVGAEKGTLTCLTGQALRTFTVKGVRGAVSAVLRDREGQTWIGTEDGVLAEFVEPDSVIVFDRGGGAVMSLFEDREGNVWVGRSSGGLHRLKRGKFVTYTERDGLASNFVSVVCPDLRGDMWVGSSGGLNFFSRSTFTTYVSSDGTPIEGITGLHVDRTGTLWIGTNTGLLRARDHKVQAVISSRGISPVAVRGVDEDASGRLWLATKQGLLVSTRESRVQPAFAKYADSAGELGEPLWAVHVARRGNDVWLATGMSGLIRIVLDKTGPRRIRYTTKDGLSTNTIRSMYEDEGGTLWLGTYHGGLIRFKDDRFTTYTTANGLFDDNVFCVLEDDVGNLWMSCNRGVFRASKRELNDFAEGNLETIRCVSYGMADGMRTFECNGGAQPSGCKSADGRLWFATPDGAAVVDPAHITLNTLPPAVVIEHVKIDGRERVMDREIHVEPGNGDLEFVYGALTFVAPEKVRFKYRLTSFDDDWVQADDRRVAYYTNIPPGQYTFTVIACNNDGVWNQNGATVVFSLNPHFHQTYWFYALCVVLIALLGSAGYHFYITYKSREQVAARLQAQLAQAELQVLKMQLQPHFLFNTLHAISSLIHTNPDAADEMMAQLGEFLRYTLEKDSVQEVPLAQELEMLDHYLEIEKIRLAERLTIHQDVPDELHSVMVPNLILQPLVENAIRHGIAPRQSGGCLEIVARKSGNRLRVSICDDGPGLPERSREGVGLSNTRLRLEQLYGENQLFEYANKPEGGVCVTLEFPLRIESHETSRSTPQRAHEDSHAHH